MLDCNLELKVLRILFVMAAVGGLWAQQPPATAAKCHIKRVRQVGLATLLRAECPENKLTMELLLSGREKAPWITKDLPVNVVPIGVEPPVKYSPGRQPRSDYTRAQPVRVLI